MPETDTDIREIAEREADLKAKLAEVRAQRKEVEEDLEAAWDYAKDRTMKARAEVERAVAAYNGLQQVNEEIFGKKVTLSNAEEAAAKHGVEGERWSQLEAEAPEGYDPLSAVEDFEE